jgi:hypothetical protein
MLKTAFLTAAMILMPVAVIAQQISTDQTDDADKLEKASVELLRDTQVEVAGLRLVENRISFSSELASLMWFHDENEARGMYAGVINDFRQLLIGYDTQINQFGPKPTTEEPDNYGMFFTGDQTDRQKVERKFRVAITVRQSIASSMAEHDPEVALNFFYESVGVISNPDLRKQIESTDKFFEQRLLEQVAAMDPVKAAQLAKKSLDRGIVTQQVDLLKKLYDKDQDKAIEFGASLLSKLKSEKPDALDLSAASSLLKYGTETLDKSRTTAGKKPIYNDSDLRDMAEALAQAVLARPTDAGVSYATYAKDVERFQPGRAIQIRSKIPPKAPGRPQQLTSLRTASVTGYASGQMGNSAAAAARAQQDQNEKKMFDDVTKIGTGKLTQEQRDKIIQQARATIMSSPTRDKKVTGLSLLAAQVFKAGDKDLANELMRDASSFVATQPKNYQDFMLTWLLASGYATVDPDKSFSILEDTIVRGNGLIDAVIKLGEFIDVNEEVISDGELEVGAFGGSMIRGITGELGMADATIQTLTKADFDKMKIVANRFDRPEIRVLAKMLVLRSVLGKKSQPANNTKGLAKPS